MKNYFYLFIGLFLIFIPLTGYSQGIDEDEEDTPQLFVPKENVAIVLNLQDNGDDLHNYNNALKYRLNIRLKYLAALLKDQAVLGNFDIRVRGKLVRVKASQAVGVTLDPYNPDAQIVQPPEFYNETEEDSRFDLHIYQNLDGSISQNFIDYTSRIYSREILLKKDIDQPGTIPSGGWRTAVLIESIEAEYPNQTDLIDPSLFTMEVTTEHLINYGKVGNEFLPSTVTFGNPPSPFAYDENDETLKWNSIENAQEYELEWFFIDKYDPLYTTLINKYKTGDPTTILDDYKYQRGVRIRVTDKYYRLRVGTELTYPEGLVYFRVRGVGERLQDGYDLDSDIIQPVTVKGDWQYCPFFLRIHGDDPTVDDFTNQYKINKERHQADKTWQYSTVYAEEGKYKKVMSYFDPSLRSGQTLTNFTTDQTFGVGNASVTLVEEQFYDYEGRQVIQTIPAPMRTASLAYQTGTSGIAGEGVNYFPNQKESYDKDHTNDTSEPLDDGSSTPNNSQDGSLTASYYSAAPLDLVNFGRIDATNPEITEFKHSDYIPISEGYAYTQVKYTQDGTGRVKAQSGVGKTFRMGGGKEVKYFYLTPTEYELKRLFGSYVGDVSHYKKVLTIDPNGQKSVAYIDQAGQTIATGLVGKTPENLRALDNNPTKGRDAGYTTIDLKKSNKRTQTLSRTEHTFFNAIPQTRYTISYDMEGAITEFKDRENESYCKVCTYEVKIYLMDDQGNRVLLSENPPPYSPITTGIDEYIKVIEPNSDDNDENNYDPDGEERPNWCEEDEDNDKFNRVKFNTIELYADLEDKEYTIIKELRLLDGEGTEFDSFTDRESTDGFTSRSLSEADRIARENCTYCAEYEDEDGNPQSLGNGANCEEILQELEAATEELASFECQSIWQSYVVDNPTLNLDSQNPIKGGGSSCYDACEDLEESRVYDFYFGNIENYDLAATGVFRNDVVDFTDPISVDDPQDRDPFWEKWLAQDQSRTIEEVQTQWLEYNIVFDGVGYSVQSLLIDDRYYENAATPEKRDEIKWAIFSGGYQLFKRAKMKEYYIGAGCSSTNDILPDQNVNNNLLDSDNLVEVKEDGDEFLDAAGSPADCGEWATLRAEAIMFGADASQCNDPNNEWDKWEAPLSDVQSNLLAFITEQLEDYCESSAYNLGNQTRDLYYDPNCYYTVLNDFMEYADGQYVISNPSADPRSILNNGTLQTDITSVDLISWFDKFITDNGLSETRQAFKAHFNRTNDPQNPTGEVYFNYEEDEWLEIAPSVVMAFIELSIRATTDDNCVSDGEYPLTEAVLGNDALENIKERLIDEGYCLTPFYAALAPAACKKYEINILHVRDYSQPVTGDFDKGLSFNFHSDSDDAKQTGIKINSVSEYFGAVFQDETTVEFFVQPNFNSNFVGQEFSLLQLIPNGRNIGEEGEKVEISIVQQQAGEYKLAVIYHYRFDDGVVRPIEYFSNPISTEQLNGCKTIAITHKTVDSGVPDSPNRDEINFYINGVSVGDAISYHRWTSSTTNILLGQNNVNTSNPSGSCIIGDVRLWKEIRTEEELSANRFGLSDEQINDPNLIGYWKMFDEPFDDGTPNDTQNNDGVLYVKDYSLVGNHSITNVASPDDVYLPTIVQQSCVSHYPMKQIRLRTCVEYDPIISEFMVYKTMDDLVEDCINDLVERAEEEVKTIRTAQKDILSKRLEEKYKNDCFKSPFKETLELKYKAAEYQYTLYYYDQAGNLYQTVPPEGVRPLNASQVRAGRDPSHKLQTTYHYNTLGQLIWQNTPDGGTSQMWVDYYGRVRLSQNQEQATIHLAAEDAIREDTQFEYAYTKYDELGRPYEAGKIDINPFNGNQDPLLESNVDLNELILDDEFPLMGTHAVLAPTEENSRATQPITFELSERTKTFYDNTNIIDAQTGTVIVDNSQQTFLRNRVSAVAVYEEGETIGAVTRYSYDIHGNVEQLWQQLPRVAISENTEEDIIFPEKTVRYIYDLLSGKVNQVVFQEGLDDEFRHKYTYDGDNKLTQVHTSLDGVHWTLEAKYFYYAHGPLARVEVGEHNIQGVDYYYTLQGWIKGVNSPEGTFGKDGTEDNSAFNSDEFAYTLHYFEGDYTARGGNPILGDAFVKDEDYSLFTNFTDATEQVVDFGGGVMGAEKYDRKSLYNGNVAAMTTSIAYFGRQENGRATQSMNYRYDQLHRIAAANSKQWNPEGGTDGNGAWEGSGLAYQTSYQYDRNGNIQKLVRRNQAEQGIDVLDYFYDGTKKNRLLRVEDIQQNRGDISESGLDYNGGAAHEYDYDEIGNLIKNGSDGIDDIQWNIQGKVERVTRGETIISYQYDASGNRIIKQVATTTTTHINYYLRDVQGNTLAIYEYDTPSETHPEPTIVLKEIPIQGGSRLGQYKPHYVQNTEGQIVKDKPTALGQRVYEFSNHLQNVLVVIADYKVPHFVIDPETQEKVFTREGFKAIVKAANDYYPFGMTMAGRTFSSEEYRYGFNGKEDDKDFGDKQLIQDYGFRLYNPAIARFLSVDPLAPSYPELTVYQFASNTPIWAIDLDGLEMTISTMMNDIQTRMNQEGVLSDEYIRESQKAQGVVGITGLAIVLAPEIVYGYNVAVGYVGAPTLSFSSISSTTGNFLLAERFTSLGIEFTGQTSSLYLTGGSYKDYDVWDLGNSFLTGLEGKLFLNSLLGAGINYRPFKDPYLVQYYDPIWQSGGISHAEFGINLGFTFGAGKYVAGMPTGSKPLDVVHGTFYDVLQKTMATPTINAINGESLFPNGVLNNNFFFTKSTQSVELPSTSHTRYHYALVKQGDTPWGISNSHDMTVMEFLFYNPQFGNTTDSQGNLNAKTFQPNMIYRIPYESEF